MVFLSTEKHKPSKSDSNYLVIVEKEKERSFAFRHFGKDSWMTDGNLEKVVAFTESKASDIVFQ